MCQTSLSGKGSTQTRWQCYYWKEKKSTRVVIHLTSEGTESKILAGKLDNMCTGLYLQVASFGTNQSFSLKCNLHHPWSSVIDVLQLAAHSYNLIRWLSQTALTMPITFLRKQTPPHVIQSPILELIISTIMANYVYYSQVCNICPA